MWVRLSFSKGIPVLLFYSPDPGWFFNGKFVVPSSDKFIGEKHEIVPIRGKAKVELAFSFLHFNGINYILIPKF